MSENENTTITLKEIIAKELIKCKKDPLYFFKKYCYIQHPQRGKILFSTYPFQDDVLNQLYKYDYNIILKSRQLGISTLVSAYSFWLMLFHNDKKILAIATKQETAKNIITKVRYMYDNLPSWLKVSYESSNKLSLRLNNGSEIKAVSSSPDAGRSESVSFLIIDEAAFIDSIEEIWGGAQQTLATGGKAVLLSTPCGVGNFFHKTWVNAENGTSIGNFKFNPIRLDWTQHPERDEIWRQQQEELLGKDLAAQECDASFLSSGRTVIDMEVLEYYKQNVICEPLEKRGPNKELYIFEYPDLSKRYLVSADVSRGDGSDYSTFHVIDLEAVAQVAEFRSQIDTKSFANELVAVASYYHNAILVIENNSVGWAVIQGVLDTQYPNLFYSSADLKLVDLEHQYSNKIHSNEKKLIAGLTTSYTSRGLMMNKLEEYFRNNDIILRSKRTLDELYVFIWKNGKQQAMNNYNDDLVMALAFALWTRDVALRLRDDSEEMSKNLIDNFAVQAVDPNAMFFNSNNNPESQWSMPINDNEKENLTWLL